MTYRLRLRKKGCAYSHLMNKILIALLSFFALVACGDNEEKPIPQPEKAQPQLALSYQDKVYPSGSTIDIAATERVFDYAPGEIVVEAGDDHPDFPSPSPVIVLNATGDHKAEATKLPLNYTATVTTTDFARFTWCGVAPECAPMTKATETRQGTLTAERPKTSLLLECGFAPKQYATVSATLQLQVAGEKVPATYTLRYTYAKK